MYRFLNGYEEYDLINLLAFNIATIGSIFFLGIKLKAPGILAKYFSILTSKKSKTAGKIVFVIVTIIELYLSARQVISTSQATSVFGKMVGTGANYYGIIILLPIATFAVSAVFVANPLKNSDTLTMLYPIFLFFVKLACFCTGCCWGISWQHGLYNHHPDHPGYQVPVQLFEMICAVGILIFLLIYRKKAQAGSLLPIYIILYSVTRFPIEFLSAAHPPVLGPFNTYHFLSIGGVLYGLLLLLALKFFGNKISAFFDNIHTKLEEKLAK